MTPAPGRPTLTLLQAYRAPGFVVTDEEAPRAQCWTFRHLRIVLEPDSAVLLAVAPVRREQIEGRAVIAVASRGNVDAAVLVRMLEAEGRVRELGLNGPRSCYARQYEPTQPVPIT